jgi:hypothetical protein
MLSRWNVGHGGSRYGRIRKVPKLGVKFPKSDQSPTGEHPNSRQSKLGCATAYRDLQPTIPRVHFIGQGLMAKIPYIPCSYCCLDDDCS